MVARLRLCALYRVGMTDYRDKLQSLGFNRRTGQSHTVPVAHEERPGVAGVVTEHWDGRQDASVFPDVTRLKSQVREP